ncbi:primosomal protein N' [Chloroflexota bacterium]
MKYAEISVNAQGAYRRTFSYSVPQGMDVLPGHTVWVPFGEKVVQGVVLELPELPAVDETREILGMVHPESLLKPTHVALAHWLSDYYLAPLFDAVSLMLPPGFSRQPQTFYELAPGTDAAEITLTEIQQTVLDFIRENGKIGLATLEKSFGQRKGREAARQLSRLGLITRKYELAPPRVAAKFAEYLRLCKTPEETLAFAAGVKRSPKLAGLLNYLARTPNVAWAEARAETGCSRAVLNTAITKGYVTTEQVSVCREPISYKNIRPATPLTLTNDQTRVLVEVISDINAPQGKLKNPLLLFGVTGSGKTEIYLRALTETVKQGRRGIVLVPEISLTPQTIERFATVFPHRVAVIHSRLSLGEQFDEWHRIRQGDFDVVIGARSALFAPQPDTGLIIIDEEHEWTYKQHDQSPRYHTRMAAEKLAVLTGATLLLGTATPDVETFYRTQTGRVRLLEMPKRITGGGVSMPQVSIVDMRTELKEGNLGIFSRQLETATHQALSRGEQVIFFLNRRGMASMVACRHCGNAVRCPRCEIPLAYHATGYPLRCHHCGYHTTVPGKCPVCSHPQMRLVGIGTEKLEKEARLAFPQARLLRWDSDMAGKRQNHEDILNKFRNRQADILIGTQMLAKGLDLPGIALVGVINADTALNFPDIRAGERTFQLLCQVSGRTGRGDHPGKAVIQTFSPSHYAVTAAAEHNYRQLYEKEISYRQTFNYPPFSQLALLVFEHTNSARCQQEARKLAAVILHERDVSGIESLDIIGPAPAFFPRRRGRFRWQIILRGQNLSEWLPRIIFSRGWSVDIDPVSIV